MGQHHGRHRLGPADAQCPALWVDLAAYPLRRGQDGQDRIGHPGLSAERTSPYQFYQYWINLDDADVGRCLRLFTDLGRRKFGTSRPGSRPIPPRSPSGAWRPN